MHDYTTTLQSNQRALTILIRLFVEEHDSTAKSYRESGVTLANIHDYNSAIQSLQLALAIRTKLFGEEHQSTADSHTELGVTKNKMDD